MPMERFRPSYDYEDERLAELVEAVAQAAPEALADGRINWETLHDLLGPALEEDEEGERAEFYGLSWPGKRDARRLAAQPPEGALHPAPGEGVDEATTRNLFIEGENLESLKLLLKAYAGRVKMIYIDPPYNTGNDFVYQDDFVEPLESYLQLTGQADEAGQRLTTNTKSGGRFHSNWLNMIYPRLVLARQLLREDGVIFVSIDDNEVHNLRQVMSELFGEENSLGTFPWKGRGGSQDSSHLSTIHEYILFFSRDKSQFSAGGMIKEGESFPKYDELKKRNYKTQLARKWGSNSRRQDRPNLFYAVKAPDGQDVYPMLSTGEDGCWRWGRPRMEREMQAGNVEFVKKGDIWVAYQKIYEPTEGEKRTKKFSTWLDDVGTTATGTAELKELFAGDSPFDFPKPIALLSRLSQIADTDDDDIVLDFFSGSCTTAQATLEQNHEDGGNRCFIMIQIPEPTDNPEFPTIAEIGKERIRRVIAKLKAAQAGKLDLEAPTDLGFKVYKLGRSVFKRWQDLEANDVAAVQAGFDAFETPLVDGWSRQELLTELLLQEGFPLDSEIVDAPKLDGNAVQVVAHDWHDHRLWVCLDDRIHDATIDRLELGRDDVFICLDHALSDQAKVRLADRGNIKTI